MKIPTTPFRSTANPFPIAADDLTVVRKENAVRFAFGFDGLWAEHIRLDDEDVYSWQYGDNEDEWYEEDYLPDD